jgi:superfamily II DNA or RNA helicase
MNLQSAIVQALQDISERTARELQAALAHDRGIQVERSAINRVLYGTPQCFRSDGNDVPRWSVVDGMASPFRLRSASTSAEAKSADVARAIPEIPAIALWRWQEEAIARWRRAGYRGVIEAVTGTGKTRLGITVALEECRGGGKVVVVVPTIELQRQWAANIVQLWPAVRIGLLGGGDSESVAGVNVLIAVVNSLRSETAVDWSQISLLIADECHRYGSDANLRALDGRVQRRLGLTATFERSDGAHAGALGEWLGGICYEMTFERAIRDDVVAHFTVALIGVDFTPSERAEYTDADGRAKRIRRKLIDEYHLPDAPIEAFFREVGRLGNGGEGDATRLARAYQHAQSMRRKVLAASKGKQDVLTAIAPAIREAERVIVFTQSKRTAEVAAAVLRESGIAAGAIHSDHKMSLRREVLDAFKEGRILAIVAPQILDEGIDVPEADLAIVLAAFQSRRQMIQRLGRVLRRKEPRRLARLALMFVRETTEDPSRGAHEDFLDDVVEAADHVAMFRDGADYAGVNAFLSHVAPDHAPPLYKPYVRGEPAPNTVVAPASTSTAQAPTAHVFAPVSQGSPLFSPSSTPNEGEGTHLPCPYCGADVLGRLLDEETIGIFEQGPPARVHNCARYTGSLAAIDIDNAPRAVWGAAMKLRATGKKSSVKPTTHDERSASVHMEARDARQKAAPSHLSSGSNAEPALTSSDSLVTATELQTALAGLQGAHNGATLQGSGLLMGIRLWDRVRQNAEVIVDHEAADAFEQLQEVLLVLKLINQKEQLDSERMRRRIASRMLSSGAGVATMTPRAMGASEPMPDLDWGKCSSCGTRIARKSIVDVCARCQR